MNPWLSLLKELALSRAEQETVARFAANPNGLSFLPIVEVLKTHELHDEAIELLGWGVERHPHYPAARVLLAKELYLRGLIVEAWTKLQVKHLPLADNILAQSLLFKCAILLGYEASARGFLQHMKRHQMLDRDTRALSNTFEIEGLGKVRAKIIADFKTRDIEVLLPKAPGDESQWSPKQGLTDLKAPSLPSSLTLASTFLHDDRLAQFHVVPLGEIFQAPANETDEESEPRGVEFDTPTLADIYAKQGHYGKALGIYRRLLKLSPHNEYLRKMVGELARQEGQQKQNDLTVDPSVVDKMEAVELIDQKMRFYNQLLARLH